MTNALGVKPTALQDLSSVSADHGCGVVHDMGMARVHERVYQRDYNYGMFQYATFTFIALFNRTVHQKSDQVNSSRLLHHAGPLVMCLSN